MGDLNARVGNYIIPGIKQRFNESVENDGELLVDLCSQNNLKINKHADKYKTILQNTRGQTSVLDYIITSRSIHAKQVLDVRTLISANIGSDHGLVLCKLRMIHTKKKPQQCPVKQKKN